MKFKKYNLKNIDIVIFYTILLKICSLYKVKYILAKTGIYKIYRDKNRNLSNLRVINL